MSEPAKGTVASIVLAWLRADRTGGKFTAAQLGQALGIGRSLVNQELRILEAKGLVLRETDSVLSHSARYWAASALLLSRILGTRDSGTRITTQG